MQTKTETPNCAPNHAFSATLRDGFALALQAEGRAPKTLTTYLDAVDALLAFASERGMPPLSELTAEHVREFVGHLYARGNKPATVSNRYRALHRFFGWLRDEGERTDNPIERIKAPRIPEQQTVEVKGEGEQDGAITASRVKIAPDGDGMQPEAN